MSRYGDSIATHEFKVYQRMFRTCPECKRVFDLTKETDAEEWAYGHDCEVDDDPNIDDEPPYGSFPEERDYGHDREEN